MAVNDKRARGFTEASVPEAYDRYLAPQLFEPWAAELVDRAGLRRGSSVLDVATGPGPVARAAAAVVGPGGRVMAIDLSAAMLAVAAAKPVDAAWAPIDFLECSATAIEVAEDSFDVVLCQQGVQFFPDRAGSVAEMRRVVRPDGVVLVSTWAGEQPLGLIGPMAEALAEAGVEEPYPGAFDPHSYSLSGPELQGLLAGAGLRQVMVETVTLDAVWPDADQAVSTLMGTPYGPSVKALPVEGQDQVRARLAERLGQSPDGTVTVRTTSHVGRGTK